MVRAIIHAGFHKTGTTSLQAYLAQHRELLSPWITYWNPKAFEGTARAARGLARRATWWRQARFRAAIASALAHAPEGPVLVLSREVLSGLIPGHKDWLGRPVRDYRAALPLAKMTVQAVRQRFGAAVKVELLYTIRRNDDWVRSAHGHLARSIRLRGSEATFRDSLSKGFDLPTEAARVAKALPDVPVHVVPLERFAEAHAGPAQAVLELAGVPNEVVRWLPRAEIMNRGTSRETHANILLMNDKIRNKRDLKQAKAALLEGGAR